MPANANATKLTDLFDPQVVADYIEQKYINAIRFAPLARMDDSLVGRPGSKVTMPYYQFVGAAENVAEGADIPIKKITQATKEVEIAKIGLAVEFTDEALLSGYNNDIVTESADQIIKAIADKVETELLEQMGKVKEALLKSGEHLRHADAKAEELTVKRLIRGNETMKEMFRDAGIDVT